VPVSAATNIGRTSDIDIVPTGLNIFCWSFPRTEVRG
jgi:hypothetical protein